MAFERLEGDKTKLDGASMNTALGKRFNENLAAEVRLGFGIMGDTDEVDEGSIEFKVGYTTGAYAKIGRNITRAFHPYALLGYTHMEVELSEDGIDKEEDINGLTYGVGMDFNLGKSTAINAEISRFDDEYNGEDVQYERITLGLVKRFK
ncbi:MAG: porin family protein [Pseudomonadota bacterium]